MASQFNHEFCSKWLLSPKRSTRGLTKGQGNTLPFCKKNHNSWCRCWCVGSASILDYNIWHNGLRMMIAAIPNCGFDPCRLLKDHGHVSTPHVAIPKSRHGSAWCPSTSGTINQLFVAHIPTSLSSGAVWTLRDGYFFSTPGTDIIHEGTPISEDPGYTCQTCRSVFGSTWAGNDPIPIFIPHRFRIFCWNCLMNHIHYGIVETLNIIVWYFWFSI